MGEWHLSKYTLFYHPPDYNFLVAVNLMKGTQTILLPEELPQLMNFKRLDRKGNLFQRFKKQGLIVNYNELDLLQTMHNKSLFYDTVNLTICPTLNCNFDCPYCFEKHIPGMMSEETQDKIVDFSKKMLKNLKANRLNISWYGGEPLLGYKIIENLSNKLIELCKEENIFYSATIITNGYLLTQEIVDMLAEKQVKSYQITIDGIDTTHDKTRRLKNGDGTFKKIIENLLSLKIQGHINIRHNVHKNNIDEVNILKKLLKNISNQSGNKIVYYPAVVADNAPEKREGQVDFLTEEEQCDLIVFQKDGIFYPGRAFFCGAQTLNCVTIDNEGNLYKCWEDVGEIKRSFGNLDYWNPSNPFYSCSNLDILIEYLNLIPQNVDEECKECIWLPMCCGGCPSKRFYHNKNCIVFKTNPDKYLSKITENIIKKWDKEYNEQEKSRTN